MISDHKRILYKIMYSYCKNPEDRKDLEQEIIIQLWGSLDRYDDKYQLSTWIYKVALNVAVSYYRKDIVFTEKNVSLDEVIFKVAEDDFSKELMDSRMVQLHQFIDKLDPFKKAIIILYLEDKSYKQIGEILGLTETNVGSKISRIKHQLKEDFSSIND
ncbi:MAG: RNA polymerase sigma factor (sigma-70 family) [Roseivirga sp.]|jgi:RNA polymerase sigma factor (sigma-70 family)